MVKIYIDPAVNINYASYYIEGMRRLYGNGSIHFNSNHFQNFRYNGQYMPLVIIKDGVVKKVIIDYRDISKINPDAYDWCDLYAKINIDFGDLQKYDKLFSIGPGFGIKTFSLFKTAWFGLTNFLKARKRIGNRRQFFSDYKAQFDRYRIEQYENSNPSSFDEVFFASSLWKTEPVTNRFRANFMKACKSNKAIKFIGGFAPRTKNDVPGFEDLIMKQRTDYATYMQKTKNSLAVFNTPAVGFCHGWKLGEYLAMGKAIITTPISKELPKAFENEKEVLITDGSVEDIANNFIRLQSEKGLKESLEANARRYFNDWLHPEKVMSLIIEKSFAK